MVIRGIIGVVTKKLLFSSFILKTELFVLKVVTASSHYPSSNRFFGGIIEKVSICFFILKSRVLEDGFLSVQSTCQYVF